MPIYEFQCEVCDENFDKLVRMTVATTVTCPSCGSVKTKKKISTFAARQGGDGSSYTSSASDCSTGST
ncbi:MAG: zinc ribbon domain-containing protein [Anaerolineae bacterium]